jgi:hypothetical protein
MRKKRVIPSNPAEVFWKKFPARSTVRGRSITHYVAMLRPDWLSRFHKHLEEEAVIRLTKEKENARAF